MTALADWMQQCGLDRRDAQVLVAAALGLSRAQQMAHPEHPLETTDLARLNVLASRVRAGEPVAYVLGEKEFFGLTFQVGPDVLIPRPDTELLVECALHRLDALPTADSPRSVLDLGTGSGAIAVAIAHARAAVQVWAVDVSEAALAVAQANARRLLDPQRAGGPIHFVQSDWFAALQNCEPASRFDCIVANPPYVAQGDPHLAALRYEPALALTGQHPSPTGLDDLRRIAAQAGAFLRAGGWLLLEHGWDQAAAVGALLTAQGWEAVSSVNDLAGIARVTAARWPQKVPHAPKIG